MKQIVISRCPDSKELGEFAYDVAREFNHHPDVKVRVEFGKPDVVRIEVEKENLLTVSEPLPSVQSVVAAVKARLKD